MRTSAAALTMVLFTSLGTAAIAVSAAAPQALPPDNPFAAASTLPYELPPFDRIRDGDFMPAYQAGMAQQLAEVGAIVANPDPPTIENTVLALESSGRLLDRVEKAFVNLNASNGDDAMRKLETELAPLLAAHDDAIHLNPGLFAHLDTLYRQREHLLLDPESFQLLLRQHKEMVLAGAKLPEAAKVQLRAYNAEISTLMAQFRQQLLKANADGAVIVEQVADLDGLSAAEVSAAADAASARGLKDKWLLALANTTTQPMLAELRNRALRERLYRASVYRGVGGNDDTTAIAARLVKLRAERARLLGYPNHAASVLDDETAGTPARADAMMRQLAPAARAGAEREAATIQKLIDSQAPAGHAGAQLQPWDWDFYSEQVRKAHYDFDEAQIRPYFELNRVLQDGVFYAAHELYGLSFRERTDLPVYGPDIRVFEVLDEGEKPLGLYIADFFARDNKQGGAWMDNYVDQSHFFSQRPVVVNNLNVPKPPAGEAVLLSFDDVRGLFHEFGHAMHGLLSDVKYQSLSGTRTPRDFVEYPSQYNEMWAREPAVLAHYARHYQTGEPMPAELLQKMIAAQNFNQGYGYTERLAASVIDLALHEVSPARAPAAKDLPAFEQAALRKSGLALRTVPPRYHASYFRHVFGDEYSAGYYAYTWSEVLARDTGEWMHRHGGLTRENGAVLRAKILSRGRTQEPSELFQAFYGKDPDAAPLLEYYGLSRPAQ
ncbi:MAG TPA: M3 family metallopeptidase [Steroidobacteraceae bacterium]|nr:M3 family metallopeptidase [Steroidobacteraceae bacterium]